MLNLERKKVYDDIVSSIMRKVAAYDRSDVIAFELIEKESRIGRYERGWGSIVRRLKRRMLKDRGIALWPVVEVGYRLCTHDEQLNKLSVARQRRATRQLTKAHNELDALPANELGLHDQTMRARKMQDVIRARRLIKSQVRMQSSQHEPGQSVPMRPART